MQLPGMLAGVLAVLSVVSPVARAAPFQQVVGKGGAAADPFAPSVDVARVTAQRVATERARAAACQAARTLPLRDGKNLGARVDADPAVAQRVTRACAEARVHDTQWSSDGGALVTVGVPLEALRLAVEPAPAPTVDPEAPPALIIDGGKLGASPPLDVQIKTPTGPVHSLPVSRDSVRVTAPGPAAVELELAAPYDDPSQPLVVELSEDELVRAIAGGAVLRIVMAPGRKR